MHLPFWDLGQRITATAAESRSFQFLMQRVIVVAQRVNAAYIVGAIPSSVDLDDLFYL